MAAIGTDSMPKGSAMPSFSFLTDDENAELPESDDDA